MHYQKIYLTIKVKNFLIALETKIVGLNLLQILLLKKIKSF